MLVSGWVVFFYIDFYHLGPGTWVREHPQDIPSLKLTACP